MYTISLEQGVHKCLELLLGEQQMSKTANRAVIIRAEFLPMMMMMMMLMMMMMMTMIMMIARTSSAAFFSAAAAACCRAS